MLVKSILLVAALCLSSTVAADDPVDGPFYSCVDSKNIEGNKCKSKCHCGVSGKLKAAQVIGEPTVSSFAECRDACLDRADCVAFGYTEATNACRLTGKKLIGQKFHAGPSRESFSNRHCFSCTQIPMAAPAPCDFQGTQVAYYSTPQYGDQNVDLTSIKGATPDATDTIGSPGGFYSMYQSDQLYHFTSDHPPSWKSYILAHRGYFYAAKKGTYTFSVEDVDDVVGVWVGSDAVSGWTNDNKLLSTMYMNNVMGQDLKTFDMERGTYYGLRTLFYNDAGAAGFQITITDPDGEKVINTYDNASDYLVQQSCDGTTAAAFPAFASES